MELRSFSINSDFAKREPDRLLSLLADLSVINHFLKIKEEFLIIFFFVYHYFMS
jgi:hypothetical protein